MGRNSESVLQIWCVKWFRFKYPKLAGLLFAVPNGGARDRITGAILKAEGVLAGVSDLILLVPNDKYHALCIEMKTAKGRQQKSQKEFQARIEKVGYAYEICRSFDEFEDMIRKYLKTTNIADL